jgi:hypothetical protein
MTLEIGRKIIAIAIAAGFLLPGGILGVASAQSNEAMVETTYNSTYSLDAADVTRPVAVDSENHLYHPGETVKVRGSVWGEVIDRVQSLNLIKVEIKDGGGDVVAMSDADLNRETGTFATSLKLPENAPGGTYTVESRIELEADALGIVEAVTSATLQSSTRIAVAEPQTHDVTLDNQTYTVKVASNSDLDGFEFKQKDKAVSIFAEGDTGTTGVMEISVPKAMLSGEMAVFIDGSLAPEEQVILKSDTETETTFEINYSHSIHQIEVTGTTVVPEFSSILAMAAVAGSVGAVATLSRNLFGGKA